MEKQVSILYVGVSPIIIGQLGSHPEIDFTVHNNLQAAENYLKTCQKPTAIVSDEYLSGGNGIEFHDKLRKNNEFDKVAFILLADEFRENVYNLAIKKRIDDFYILPGPPVDNLLNRIKFLRDYRTKYAVEPPKFVEDVDIPMPLSKRIFDLVVACSALLILSPLLLLVIIAIRLESKGKVYYTSRRFGSSKYFDFYKLRSMRMGADAELDKLSKERNQYAAASKQPGEDIQDSIYSKPCPRCAKLPEGQYCSNLMKGDTHNICEYWFREQLNMQENAIFTKISNDPRVTRVGKFIRNTSIDELPQLINVIKGDMSIVGNRPLPMGEVQFLTSDWVRVQYDDKLDTVAKRMCAPAGITGLWQVELRGKGGNMSKEERMKYDIGYYRENLADGKYSFWYDLKLILRTFNALFQKDSV